MTLSRPIYLSIGTNMGDRIHNLNLALTGLRKFMILDKVSAVYETAPWGPIQDQPSFYNICASGKTHLDPHDFLDRSKALEAEIGRLDGLRWGPRLIDVDLLFYEDVKLVSERLIIPHKEVAGRAFVLAPLAEIEPDLRHPVLNQTVQALLNDLPKAEIETVVKLAGPKLQAKVQWSPILQRPPNPIIWGERTYVMGILNATPDSFSGDGIAADLTATQVIDAAVEQAIIFVNAGADILDIGGESTRPSSEPISGETERLRILDVIREVRGALPDTVISVDTYRAKTAELALAAGADWINDIWGFKHDPDIASVATDANCPVVLMHNGRNRPRFEKDDGAGGYYGYFEYENLIKDILSEMQQSVDIALKAGVQSSNIIIDPGIGFGKTAPQNLELLNKMGLFKTLGYPILLGTSRKGFIGQYLGGLSAEERVEGTLATNVLGIASGADIVRVHDVQATARAVRMADVILRPNFT